MSYISFVQHVNAIGHEFNVNKSIVYILYSVFNRNTHKADYVIISQKSNCIFQVQKLRPLTGGCM